VWFGWCDGDDSDNFCGVAPEIGASIDGNNSAEQSTSQSMTERRKIGHIENKGAVNEGKT
jgi:hypothetical protein